MRSFKFNYFFLLLLTVVVLAGCGNKQVETAQPPETGGTVEEEANGVPQEHTPQVPEGALTEEDIPEEAVVLEQEVIVEEPEEEAESGEEIILPDEDAGDTLPEESADGDLGDEGAADDEEAPITGDDSGDEAIINEAAEKLDASLCDSLSNPENKDECTNAVEIAQEKASQEPEGAGASVSDFDILSEAVSTGNSSLCSQISDEEYRNSCLSEVANQ